TAVDQSAFKWHIDGCLSFGINAAACSSLVRTEEAFQIKKMKHFHAEPSQKTSDTPFTFNFLLHCVSPASRPLREWIARQKGESTDSDDDFANNGSTPGKPSDNARSKSRRLQGPEVFPTDGWKHKPQKAAGQLNQHENPNVKGNGRKSQEAAYVKKVANGNAVSSQQVKTILKDDKRLQPRRLQDSFDKDAALYNSTNGHQTVHSRDFQHLFSSKAFLNFKFDKEAIMKCFDY
ncbi:hypothetical protein LDENG_00159630, partial [Lucifuga dentata]